MRRLRNFFRLPPADRRLSIESWFLLWVVRLGLWLIPFPTLNRILDRGSTPKPGVPAAAPASIDFAVRAVIRASRFVPKAACLTQALAARSLLRRRGCPAVLHIGVLKNEKSVFKAHAWLTCGGKVVIGSQDEEIFTPLLARTAGDLTDLLPANPPKPPRGSGEGGESPGRKTRA